MWIVDVLDRWLNRSNYFQEYLAWCHGQYPYDGLCGCRTCVTDHAVLGCKVLEHAPFTELAREAGLDVHVELICGHSLQESRWKKRILLGQFLVRNRVNVWRIRRLYDDLYKPSSQRVAERKETNV